MWTWVLRCYRFRNDIWTFFQPVFSFYLQHSETLSYVSPTTEMLKLLKPNMTRTSQWPRRWWTDVWSSADESIIKLISFLLNTEALILMRFVAVVTGLQLTMGEAICYRAHRDITATPSLPTSEDAHRHDDSYKLKAVWSFFCWLW